MIFLWANSKTAPVKDSDGYARYFLYECDVRDAVKYHRALIAEGYFEEASVEQTLNSLKVTEPKEILAAIGASMIGKKDALIWRVANNAAPYVVACYCPGKRYTLSETGKVFLKEHTDYVMIHKHKNWDISWHAHDANHKPGRNFFDTVWGILNAGVLKDTQNFGHNAVWAPLSP